MNVTSHVADDSLNVAVPSNGEFVRRAGRRVETAQARVAAPIDNLVIAADDTGIILVTIDEV